MPYRPSDLTTFGLPRRSSFQTTSPSTGDGPGHSSYFDEMPDGVDLDAGRLDRLLDGLVDRAEEARSHWREAWKRHDATARFEGQPFETDPMEELAGLLIEAVEHADAAYELVNEATTAYWERHPDDEDDDEDVDEP